MLRKYSMTMIAITVSAAAAFGSAAKDTSKAAAGIVVEPAAKSAATASAAPAAKPAATTSAAPAASAAPAKPGAAATANAGTPCEEVKAKLSEKLTAKGVKTFTLDAVPKEQDAKDGKVIGSCEGGAKKIVYKKG